MAALSVDGVVYSPWPCAAGSSFCVWKVFRKSISCLWGNGSITLSLSSLAEGHANTSHGSLACLHPGVGVGAQP